MCCDYLTEKCYKFYMIFMPCNQDINYYNIIILPNGFMLFNKEIPADREYILTH